MEDEVLHTGTNYRSLSEQLQHKINEDALTRIEGEERYHKMIEEIQDYAILLLDVDGNIQNWNKGAQKIKGYSEQDIVGKNFRIFYQDSDREDLLPEKLINEATTNGRANHEGWRVRSDGSIFWGLVVITALHDADNNIIGFSKVTRDLTERKLAEDRIKEYARDIELRNQQLEEYAYIASHDLQEPLRKIQVFTEMLENSLDDKEMAMRHLDKISTSAKRMSHLIKDVLKYSQVAQTEAMFSSVNLNKILVDIIEDYELLVHEKGVIINTGKLPEIKGILIQVQQLFSNLLGNAIKFSGQNPTIDITATPLSDFEAAQYKGFSKDRSYTKILFKDNGQGFDPQYSEQVFKMFKRLTTNSGTGIGLALCKKIVENHGGIISVESQQGKGSTFTVILPVD
ncbi:MAG: ATP-binding protein [Bacteroidota bacterium]